MSGTVHFWTLRNRLEDPDLQPDRSLEGYGHSFLELCVRLKARGFPVAIAPLMERPYR